ncbi:MAG: hypothetical protein KDC84_15525 [Crocinitomicaceae bacterium]|nr:hypothetical protein [Crocinitomicaceae bacterium]
MKNLEGFLFMAILLFAFSCDKGKNNPRSCNGETTRRDVKICIDDLAAVIDTIPIQISVDSIGALNVPEISRDDPRQDVEKRVFTITAKVHKISKHRDGDWKVKLTDGNDKFINCESPNPGCEFIPTSRFLDKIILSRDWIEAHQDEIVGKVVTITGVGFIDIDHVYPRNAAENEMELHPILDIHY